MSKGEEAENPEEHLDRDQGSEDEERGIPDPERREFIASLKKEILGDLLTTAEVAEILDVHPRTVGEYIREGRLLATQIGGAWRISVEHVKAFVQGESFRSPRGMSDVAKRAIEEGQRVVAKSKNPTSMFERFTDRARRAVVLAQSEARGFKHNYIGTEHLLLGLLGTEGVAARALERLGVDEEQARARVAEIVGKGSKLVEGHLPFTPRGKTVLELSLREALQLGHRYIGTEHILLGLIREGEGVGSQVLVDLGAELGEVRSQVVLILSEARDSGESGESSEQAE